jgi:hypothetical protein
MHAHVFSGRSERQLNQDSRQDTSIIYIYIQLYMHKCLYMYKYMVRNERIRSFRASYHKQIHDMFRRVILGRGRCILMMRFPLAAAGVSMADVAIDKIETISGGVYLSSRQTRPWASAILELSVWAIGDSLQYTCNKQAQKNKTPPSLAFLEYVRTPDRRASTCARSPPGGLD